MINLSLCMIVKNEEAVLERCLESVHGIADEIIIADTGSTDNTVSIAKKFTDHVYSFEWTDDFSAARNFSYSKATKEYIMWLDADDVIDEKNRQLLITLKETLPSETDVVMLPYNTAFDASGNPTFSCFRERITRRSPSFLWREPVHEHLPISGAVEQRDAAVSHMPGVRAPGHSDRNLRIYRSRVSKGEPLSTRGMYYFARELKAHGLLDEAAAQYELVLRQNDIWKEDALTASADLADCYIAKETPEKALRRLFESFAYDLPRAEILCRIGLIYAQKDDSQKAVYWYELALNAPRPNVWGFISQDYWEYIPHMQLCMLYDRSGNHEKALSHHKAAKAIKPEGAEVRHNEEYFNKCGAV